MRMVVEILVMPFLFFMVVMLLNRSNERERERELNFLLFINSLLIKCHSKLFVSTWVTLRSDV